MPPEIEWTTNAKVFIYDTESKKWYALTKQEIESIISNLAMLFQSLAVMGEWWASNDFIQPDKSYSLTVPAGSSVAEVSIEAGAGEVLWVRAINLSAPSLPSGVTAKYNVIFDDTKNLYTNGKSWTDAVTIDLTAILGKEIRCKKVTVKVELSTELGTETSVGSFTTVIRKAPSLVG